VCRPAGYLKCWDICNPRQLSYSAGRIAQVVEHLPSKCEALNLNPSTVKKGEGGGGGEGRRKKEKKFPKGHKPGVSESTFLVLS
jgi:hypothetical protein